MPMRVQVRHSPTGALVIEIDDPCQGCRHTHPTDQEAWSQVITSTGAWLAKNSPVCRSFPGILPWARGDAPAAKLSCWGTALPNAAPSSSTGPGTFQGLLNQHVLVPMGMPDAGGVPMRPAPSTASSASPHDMPMATPVLCPTPAMSSLVMRTQKPIRSVFGCTTCKKRKVKCDEKRPRCGNCSKKSARECVYLYEVAPWVRGLDEVPIPLVTLPAGTVIPSGAAVPHPPSTPGAGPSKPPLHPPPSALRGTAVPPPLPPPPPRDEKPVLDRALDGTVGSTSSALSSIPSVESEPARMAVAPRNPDRQQRPSSTLALSSILSPVGHPAAEQLSRYIEAHGMTWFIEASEVIDQEKFQSQRKRTYSERRQAILAYCWDTYLEYQGKLPLELQGMDDINNLANAGVLYSFVAVGAFHYAYWSKFRKMPSAEHYAGAHALGELALEAAQRLVPRQANDPYPDREVEAKFFITISLFVTYAAPAASRRAWDALALLGHLARLHHGIERLVLHLDEDPVTAPSTVDALTGAVVDMAQALLRGTDTNLAPSDSYHWLDSHPIAQRVLPEGFGYSVSMAKLAFETIAVLYGRFASDTVSPPLKTLYRTLSTTSLVTVYSSPQPPRVQTGDLLIRRSLFLLIYIDGFRLRPDDVQVVRTSDMILELFSEALCNGMYTIRWLLPMIVGSCLCSKDRRQAVIDIYDSMTATCGCDDIAVARRLTEEVWARRDAGREDWSWRHVFRDEEDMDILYI